MNKIEIFECLKKYNLPKEKFVILSGASLVLRNIKSNTSDIDIVVTEDIEKLLLNQYNNVEIERYDKDSNKQIYMLDNILNFSSNLSYILENKEYEMLNGYQIQSLDSIVQLKQKLGRQKDYEDIKYIQNYLKQKATNVLALAYIGDSVYEVFIREYLLRQGIVKVNELQKKAVSYVSAKGQSKYLLKMIENNFFTEEELQVIKRARNHKSHTSKTTDIRTYKNSTGLEALIGYLYLNGEKERIEQIMKCIVGE